MTQGLTTVVSLVLLVFWVRFLDRTYAVKDWFFWDLLKIWGYLAFLSVACGGVGATALERLGSFENTSPLARLALALPLGLVVFALGMYLGGALTVLGPVFAIVWPALMLAVGAPALVRAWRAFASEDPPRLGTPVLLVIVAGGACVLFLMVQALSPNTLNYDATWTHVVIAQNYAREGRLLANPGDWVQNVPHLASLVYTWVYMTPGLNPAPLRWIGILQAEWTIFLWTLVGVSALAAWFADRARLPGGWAVFFLFPSIFVYDSSMGGAADHVMAVFPCAIMLAAMHLWLRFERGPAVVLGVLMAGAALTKMQAAYVIAPVLVLLGARWFQVVIRLRRGANHELPLRQVLLAPAVLAVTAILVVSPHFIKNYIQYGNPFFPFMQDVFASVPTVPDAALLVNTLFADWRHRAPSALSSRLLEALKLLFTFSFDPHYSFIGPRPYFGSLFTVFLALLPFIQRARRLWIGAFVGCGAIFFWAMNYWVDRNLQTFLPILVATTAAIIVRAWAIGRLVRMGIAALVGLQLVWGVDLMFSGQDRFAAGVSMIRSGFDGRAKNRYDEFRRDYIRLGESLPQDALVVMHNSHNTLGINRRILLDWIGFQGAIDYRSMRTPRDVYDQFRALGVTHVVYLLGNHGAASKQEDVLFSAFAHLYGGPKQSFGGLQVFAMPTTPPPVTGPWKVAVMDIGPYQNGVYEVSDLSNCEWAPPSMQRVVTPRAPLEPAEGVAASLAQVDAVLVGGVAGRDPIVSEILRREFPVVAHYPGFVVHIRTNRAMPAALLNSAGSGGGS